MTVEIYETTNVFTPGDFPTHTYVAVDESRNENSLRKALATPGMVASLSGPSKSGKTVLVRRVAGGANSVIRVSGAEVRTANDLWHAVLDRLGTPDVLTQEQSSTKGVSGGANVSVPLSSSPGAPTLDIHGSASAQSKYKSTAEFNRKGMQYAIELLRSRNLVLLVDDFHYMTHDTQTQVAREIREAAQQGAKICVASVPHRSDDVVRSNPELRGRITAIDSGYWRPESLKAIGEKGFPLLRVVAGNELLSAFAAESLGSPQLMQALCLEACRNQGVCETGINEHELPNRVGFREEIFREVSATADFRSALQAAHAGELSRGVQRKTYRFTDETEGDSYRAVLLAIAQPPPALSISKADVIARVAAVCVDERPSTPRIVHSCKFVAKRLKEIAPSERIVEYEDDVLTVIDPYFLFYLRWSGQLDAIATRHTRS
jgi:hypothetical protein